MQVLLYRYRCCYPGIVDYMLGQVGEGSKELMSQKKMAAYMHAEDVTVIGFFASAEDAAYNLFQDVGEFLRRLCWLLMCCLQQVLNF